MKNDGIRIIKVGSAVDGMEIEHILWTGIIMEAQLLLLSRAA